MLSGSKINPDVVTPNQKHQEHLFQTDLKERLAITELIGFLIDLILHHLCQEITEYD